MKIYIEPLPKACCVCPLARKVLPEDKTPWYTCFPTGRTHTSILTERPKDCPIEE